MVNTALIGFLIGLILVDAAAQYCTKKGYVTKNKAFVIAAFILYGFAAMLLYFSYKYTTMGLMNVLWNAASTVLILMIGMYMFGEKINKYDFLGIVLTFLGIYFIFMYGRTSELEKMGKSVF